MCVRLCLELHLCCVRCAFRSFLLHPGGIWWSRIFCKFNYDFFLHNSISNPLIQTPEIGFALSASGLLAGLLQIFFMPPILRRVDHASLYHFCMKIWPYVFIALPFLNVIARRGVIVETGLLTPHTILILWSGIVLILSMARVAFLAYSYVCPAPLYSRVSLLDSC